MAALNPLLSGLVFPESPRWHDDRLWLADWGAHEVIAVDRDGKSEVVAEVASFPFSIDWLPDGRLLAVSAATAVFCAGMDGSLVTHAELGSVSERPWNEIVVDGRGNIYLNNIGFDFPGEDFAPGMIALVRPDGSVRQVADEVAFPNGMAVTGDNSTLVLAESYGNTLTAFDIAPTALCPTGEFGPTWARGYRTASAWMRRGPSGTRTCLTNTASEYAKGERSYKRSIWTEDALPACWVGLRVGHFLSWPTNGQGQRRCPARPAPGKW